MITSRPFGTLPDGRLVHAHTLTNAHGLRMVVLDYGGIVTELHVPDRHGRLADITLGYDTLEPYLANPNFFGCITGRVAGRINSGRFTLDGQSYQLERNLPPHHLHGGRNALNARLWTATPAGDNAIRLTYLSPDGDNGYPGNLPLSVTYTLTDDNAWRVDEEATTDKPTPLSLTQHAYFNLAGHDALPPLDHVVQIHANEFVPVDDVCTLLGRRESVDGKPCDLRSPRRLSDVIDGLQLRHGDLYVLPSSGTLQLAATCRHDPTGRQMDTLTTNPMIQFYTGVNMQTGVGKSGAPHAKFAALGFEAQNYPDGVNAPSIGDIILRPGHNYRQTTVYQFSTFAD